MPNHNRTPDTLTTNRNFKVSATLDAFIDSTAGELGIPASEFLRLCIYIGGPLLLTSPCLARFNRQELGEVAANVGNKLVIHSARVEIKGEGDGN